MLLKGKMAAVHFSLRHDVGLAHTTQYTQRALGILMLNLASLAFK